jgi:uncharacterized protein with HEPN domain
MLDGARSSRDFTSGVTQGEYLKDRKLQLAVERALEIRIKDPQDVDFDQRLIE